jgi:hypothetical protein
MLCSPLRADPMQFIPDASWTPEQRWLAGRAFLENDHQVVAGMSAHQWAIETATLEQVLAAMQAAETIVADAEAELPACLERHNPYQDAFGLPPLSLDEFRGLVTCLLVYEQLLNLLATGTMQ